MFVMCAMDYWSLHESNNTTAGEKLGLYLVLFVVAENDGFIEFADSIAAVGKVGFVAFVDFVVIEPFFTASTPTASPTLTVSATSTTVVRSVVDRHVTILLDWIAVYWLHDGNLLWLWGGRKLF